MIGIPTIPVKYNLYCIYFCYMDLLPQPLLCQQMRRNKQQWTTRVSTVLPYVWYKLEIHQIIPDILSTVLSCHCSNMLSDKTVEVSKRYNFFF